MPARSGVLGCVGVVDRSPGKQLVGVTNAQDLIEMFGPATRYSFPEMMSALANGVSEVVVSPVDERTGSVARVVLKDDEGEDVAVLRARAVGPWGNELAVVVRRNLASDGRTVRSVNLEVLLGGSVIERHDNLILRAGSDSDLFTAINRDSGVIVAVDPVFETDLPATDSNPVPLTDSGAQAAIGQIVAPGGGALVELAAASAGAAGNRISVEAAEGRALAVFNDGAASASVRVRARVPGADGATITVRFTDDGLGGVDATVVGIGGNTRNYTGLSTVDAVVTALNTDPDVLAEKAGDLLPAVTPSPVALAATVTLTVRIEGVRTTDLEDLISAQAAIDAITADGAMTATLAGGADANDLPDTSTDNAFYLSGGRDAGLARGYAGQTNITNTILEIVPAQGVDGSSIQLRMQTGSESNTVRLEVGNDLSGSFEVDETWDNLTMDPDSLGYLPLVLQNSLKVRAIDRYLRSRATHYPAATVQPAKLTQGAAPAFSAWQSAIDALALEDSVDLMLAGLQGWKDADLDGIAVQQAMLGHARAQADNARPRIALGSVEPDASDDLAAILDHVGQVRDRRFVLVTPSGAEGALAGLLGHLAFFESPTFKTIAAPGVPLEVYSDGQLNKLVGPDGNVCVITRKRGRGTICVKGIATDGFQISVTRIADRCIREVKAIADRFIGELNNAEKRNALKQMIIATFSQLERDGALVPSVDGESPAFLVDVYASQNDTAAGIVRIDIAVRPVRAIDYIYATIRVKN
ncbi:phage tail sheath C-terminal domain-containing protein [Haliangium sp.]|uniref:phage tail sheath C-terminal domain-containing protein n=1 Tax=Haliangium sp. TaxID=2663208 RepID=UPI003D0B337B